MAICSKAFFLLITAAAAAAADSDSLQDLCVADLNSTIKINGFLCKPPTYPFVQNPTFLLSYSPHPPPPSHPFNPMAISSKAFFLLITAAAAALTAAADSDSLQDLCVADLNSTIKINGFLCKPSAAVTPDDFFFNGLATPAATNNTLGSVVTPANVEKIAGLNTLGVSMSRIDYAPGGLNPPHIHPRATEIIFVLYGTLHVGFITTANKLVAKTVNQGDNFVFPRGLLHFQKNDGDKPAAVIAAFNSQLPGTQGVAAALFGSSPPVADDVLGKAFQIRRKEVEKIKGRLATKIKS